MPKAPSEVRTIVSRETVERLEIFVDLFLKWSKRINLSAPSTLAEIWQRHILDSLGLINIQPSPKRWVDLGSGGGFPGAVTAIVLAEQDAGHVDLIESNQKKASFLRQVLRETGARGAVHAVRIEDAAGLVEQPECISARALADLSALLSLSSPWLIERNCTAYFHKGRDYRREVDEARGRWVFDLVEHPSRTNPESVVLEIGNLSRR